MLKRQIAEKEEAWMYHLSHTPCYYQELEKWRI
jgi:hypothetical protein